MTKARNIADLLDANGIVDNAKITLDANEIPNLDASKIVSGDISAARLSLATETKPVVSSVSPSVITNDAQNIVITGTDFTAIPRVDIINTATGIWYSVNTVTHNSATQLTVNLTLSVDAGTYRIRVENPDGLAGLSGANFLTVSDAPTWSTSAGSLGSVAGGLNGAVATVSASGDTIVYSETTNVLTNASLANCSLNSSTGAITSTDFDGSSTSARTHTFTIRATDTQGQTSDREFTLTSSYNYLASILIVAGGGGGGTGGGEGGGGGAGGLIYYGSETPKTPTGGAVTLLGQTTYTVTVGAGGSGATGYGANGGNGTSGGNSSFTGSGLSLTTALGGGIGGNYPDNGAGHGNGTSGGSGGGGGGNSGASGNSQSGGSGTSGQGFAGGNGNVHQGGQFEGGGGGGAGEQGKTGSSFSGFQGGGGGHGLAYAITGSSTYYAGGGGGHTNGGTQGEGGNGGGGTGNGSNGTANTGGGGGGASGDGGSGVVILSVPSVSYSGNITGSPTVAVSGNQRIITFTQNGTYTG